MAVDFRRLFKDFHIPTRNNVKNWCNINCPFCKNPVDEHFNGGFNILSPRYNCWRCGSHSYWDALSEVLNIPINQVGQLINNYSFLSQDKEIKHIAQAEHLDLPGFMLNENEKKYLVDRGFNVDYLQSKFHLRGGGIAGTWSYRILIPIYYNRVLVSWTGRSILPKETLKELEIPRYKNLSIEQSVINPKEIFFNLDNSTQDKVMLVEGAFDVMRVGDGCICSLGTSVTDEQILFLKNRYKKIFVCFDNEVSAQIKAKKTAMKLSSVGLEVEVVNICEPFNKNDPGELSYSEVVEIKKELEF